jgi:predicted nucleotidyltransferase
MRLSTDQINTILNSVAQVLGDDALFVGVYGSRLDDAGRGGDVDLYLETTCPVPLLRRAALALELEKQLGLPVDLLVHVASTAYTPFQLIARKNSMCLKEAA